MVPLYYGPNSLKNLLTTTNKIQTVFHAALALQLIDISIIEGVRGKAEQNRYYDLNKSRVQWPDGKHNVLVEGDKSRAVDAGPYINGKISYDHRHCCFLAGIVLGVGSVMGINLRWGGNWDMDHEPITDQEFQDLVHYEEID